MITWGQTPAASTASVYLPAVDADEIIALANAMYRTHRLAARGPNTIECPAHGVTLIPLPTGQGRCAGLLSVQLPGGVRRGDAYDIVVRQLTEATAHVKRLGAERATAEVGSAVTGNLVWRRLVGTFQVALAIKVKQELLYPEERLLAWLKWRLETTPHRDRWYEVLREYARLVAGRVAGFGGDPGKIKPSQFGDVPGRERPPHHRGRGVQYTGKVASIVYDRFGDFEGFVLLTYEGHERHFAGRERDVEALITRAWVERIAISVVVEPDRPEWPANIILRRPPHRA
jgi:hypothetical protein